MVSSKNVGASSELFSNGKNDPTFIAKAQSLASLTRHDRRGQVDRRPQACRNIEQEFLNCCSTICEPRPVHPQRKSYTRRCGRRREYRPTKCSCRGCSEIRRH